MNKPNTELVVFRKFPEGDLIALFPNDSTHSGYINSYQHVGQHGDASPELIRDLEPAEPAEYEELLEELREIGYTNIEVDDET